jgi:hypothetical protein
MMSGFVIQNKVWLDIIKRSSLYKMSYRVMWYFKEILHNKHCSHIWLYMMFL